MSQATAASALEEWRRGERLLGGLPPDAPERADVQVAIDQLRDTYQQASEDASLGRFDRIDWLTTQLQRAVAVLDDVMQRYGVSSGGEEGGPEPA